MSMTSAAEAKLDARIRPDVTLLFSRTSYRTRLRRTGTVGNVEPGGASPADARAGASEDGSGDQAIPLPGPARPEADRSVAVRPVRSKPAPIRLTRRGRIVVAVLVVIGAATTVSLLWLAVASQAQASSHVQGGVPSDHSLRRVQVRAGQTLWSIAVQADPAADPRVIISEIVDDNSLADTTIQAGQVLWMPRS
ncbi:MAG TPA: LysM peptidoglycan-binding domain-containing protein [Streptosporangiaceae bacterium]|nr:LysM peptidoglycan-binding domain-containing protein [Streptosporangiaceae bacterium]